MNYQKALLYLKRFVDYEKFSNYNYRSSYSLDRVRGLLRLLDNPQERYPCVIISGTKGKGSTAIILTSILNRAGIKTGLFTSPHLVSLRERIKIGKRPIPEKHFCDLISLIRKAIEKGGLRGLTFFEILTSLGFLYFARNRIDLAVLEVGLGGRLDATNVTASEISAITPISYDHTHLLGASLGKIAREKCGIIHEGSFVVSAPQEKEALEVIKETAQSEKAELLIVGRDIVYDNLKISISGTGFDAKTPYSFYNNLRLSLIGRHQAINALTSLGIAEGLKIRYGFKIKAGDIRQALKEIEFPARFDIASESPYIILDGAQNEASACALEETFTRVFGKRHKTTLILGVSSDKDIEGIGKVLCPLADKVIFTKAASPRAMTPAVLAQRLGRFCRDYSAAYDVRDALIFAKEGSGREDVILISGSLFLAADILKEIAKGG